MSILPWNWIGSTTCKISNWETKYKSHGFKNSQDFAIRHQTGYWHRPQTEGSAQDCDISILQKIIQFHINSLWPSDVTATQIWVIIGSPNDLLPDGTKPLSEPILTKHQWSLVAFTWVQFHRKHSRYQMNLINKIVKLLHFSGANELTPPNTLKQSPYIYINMGQVTKVWLSCYLVLLSVDSKTR